MARSNYLSLLLVPLVGCSHQPNQVHFLVPNGYRGAFAVRPDDPHGQELKKGKGTFIIRVPESGTFEMKGYDPNGT
jgi:hypothetical protein